MLATLPREQGDQHRDAAGPLSLIVLVLSCLLQVQLTLLTAIVKLFLKKPSETQELVQQVLSLATQVSQGQGEKPSRISAGSVQRSVQAGFYK